MSRRVPVEAWLAILAGIAAGCGESTGGPSHSQPPDLIIYCGIPVDATVRCTAMVFNRVATGSSEDVTQAATWIVSPPEIGGFASPGVLHPNARGEATISARYDAWTGQSTTFLVDPAATARWLYHGFFRTVETDGTTPVPGVTVVVTSGYRSGASCVTDVRGSCTIDRLLTYEEFTGTATKAGYRTESFTRQASPPVGEGLPFPPVPMSRN